MHRTEGTNYAPGNLFQNGPPGTVVEQEWLNAVQEELANVIEEAGLTLKSAATETRDQLKAALDLLYPSHNHNASHIRNGGDEIDGDKLDVDYNPAGTSSYVPNSDPAEVDHVDNLTAHLRGINDKFRSLRQTKCYIVKGTTGIKPTSSGVSTLVGDSWPTTDNVIKGYNGTNYALNAAGNELTLKQARFVDADVALGAQAVIYKNEYATHIYVEAVISGGDIVLKFTGQGPSPANDPDLTALITGTTDSIEIDIFYIVNPA